MAVSKFGRNYSLKIESFVSNTIIPIAPPFTIEFDIKRSRFSGNCVASVRIYNLGIKLRDLIRKDRYDTGNLKTITLMAGYGKNLYTILKSDITQAWSARQGIDIITNIECLNYTDANAELETNYPANTTQKDIILDMIGTLSSTGIGVGSIGNSFNSQKNRANYYSGPTSDVLTELTGGQYFIDNGLAHCLSDTESIPDPPFIINSSSGLLGTPYRENINVSFEILFEPSVKIGQRILVQSDVEKIFGNTSFCIQQIHHRGMISEAVCGDARTSIECTGGVFTPIPSASTQ